MNRRDFLQQSIVCGAATAFGMSASASLGARAVKWPIGCFNRPWTKWSFDDTLKQIKAAGYQTTRLAHAHKRRAVHRRGRDARVSGALKQRIAASGLTANMGALRSRHNIPLDESIKEARKQIDNAGALALTYLLTFGVDKPEEYEHYYKVMSDAAAYAQERKIKLVMKPHGGGSGASDEIVAGHESGHPSQLQNLVRRGQHHLLHGQGPDRRAEADRASTSPASARRIAARSKAT